MLIVIFNYILHSLSVGDTTIYWGGSLVEKIIIRVYFVIQPVYFLYFRSRHAMQTLH
jgi:hypothetical protein